VRKYRSHIEAYISRHPEFQTSLTPLAVTDDSPAIVTAMTEAGTKAGVGPMAAVAGAIAEFVGIELIEYSPEVLIENGGDIYLKSTEARVVGIYAGDSPLSGKIGLEIAPEETPMGICTSSGTVGHSFSLGKADAAVILSPSATLADAVATAVGNRVRRPEDIPQALDFALGIPGVIGTVIVKDDKIGSSGGVRLCRTSMNSGTL
jgi:ApbE superfamily uncharacterized protein (UPF0280 family)